MILIRVDNMSAINTKAEMCGEADELPRCPQLLSSADPRAPHLVPPCTGPCMPPSPDALLFASTALGTAEKSQSTQCVCGGGGVGSRSLTASHCPHPRNHSPHLTRWTLQLQSVEMVVQRELRLHGSPKA